MKQESLKVTGMSCIACENRIERALSRLDGVARARANRLKGEVQIVYDPARTTNEQVCGAIETAGYEVISPQ